MITFLNNKDRFPSLIQSLNAPEHLNGLLAATSELTLERLREAYERGIYPWGNEGNYTLWWSPDPRMVLMPKNFKISHSLKKTIKKVLSDTHWEIKVNADFKGVMQDCAAANREKQIGTWINSDMILVYSKMNQLGQAHSVESYYAGVRVGGLYGVCLGKMFYGESMFSKRTDASKIALAALIQYCLVSDIKMIDCQQKTAHLASMGAAEISRAFFIDHINEAINAAPLNWQFDKSILAKV